MYAQTRMTLKILLACISLLKRSSIKHQFNFNLTLDFLLNIRKSDIKKIYNDVKFNFFLPLHVLAGLQKFKSGIISYTA